MDDFDKALLYGYELANGRGWFSLASSSEHVDPVYGSLLLSGYLRPYSMNGNLSTKQFNYWRWDYAFTPKGLWRIQELTQKVDWYEKAKSAYEAYCAEYRGQQYTEHIYTWDELTPVHHHAWVAAVKAIADGFNMRWADTDILVTSENKQPSTPEGGAND